MIGKLTGVVDIVDEDFLILDVNGVGYLIHCTSDTLSKVKPDQSFTLHIDMIVKEDQLSLYGFLDITQKRWFKLLQTVQGVGAKMALSVLSALNPDKLSSAILSGDSHVFRKVQGVGPKIASRIINELKGKDSIVNLSLNKNPAAANEPSGSSIMDAVSALSNLGFSRSDAYRVISEISAANDAMPLEQLIKQGLAKLSINR